MSWNLVMEPWTSSFLYYVLKQKEDLMFWTLKKKKKKTQTGSVVSHSAVSGFWYMSSALEVEVECFNV